MIVTMDEIRQLESKLVFWRIRKMHRPVFIASGRWRWYRELDAKDMTGWVEGWNSKEPAFVIVCSSSIIFPSKDMPSYRIFLDDIFGYRVLMDNIDEELPGPCPSSNELIHYLAPLYGLESDLNPIRIPFIQRHLEWCGVVSMPSCR